MAAQLIYVRATRLNQHGSRIVIPPMHTTRTRTSTRTPIIYSMRNMRRMRRTRPRAQCTARSDNQRRSIAPLILSHLDRFPENLGDQSEEQGERFHQDIRTMEEGYQGHWNAHMTADYCGSIKNCPQEND
ncbi:unnamed protein product [Arctia plantaginis]|uniref:Uncharacterized protein n=1 Tax=Arctia plantaginis TaxID=874455 RepID=A0A8S0ZUW0_ARCPL|nr:unnamed protein product [Arctia plantaginis]